ncbi:hypothetical protein D9758_010146 [Tetrapyrgos nigripes]|uniref:Translation initiation factor IF-3 n=1 Tax=Tetrapyrgos nigripes TaxID=182062 RepID=A0A8H5FRH8_9AGAR|nr:hypothetical protein D9758_010146 [Tetrapyrgos nigripes]
MNIFQNFRVCTRRASMPSTPPPSPRRPPEYPPKYPPKNATKDNPDDSKSKKAAQVDRKPKNENIPFDKVLLADDSGQLSEFHMQVILTNLDRKTHFVELQSIYPTPIVKIISKSDAHQKKLKMKQQQKVMARINVTKEFQFTWGMAKGDLDHRMGRVREALGKGFKVDIAFAPKPGTRGGPLKVEMMPRMEELVESMKDVSVEYKKMEFRRFTAAVFLQGNGKSVPNSEPEPGPASE